MSRRHLSKSEIFEFVRRHAQGMPVDVEFYKGKPPNAYVSKAWAANAYYRMRHGKLTDCTIQLQLSFMNNNRREQKAILLHELGHYIEGSKYEGSSVLMECHSHLWALKTAKLEGMKTVRRDLLHTLGWWLKGEWNAKGIDRRYILAARMILKRLPRSDLKEVVFP